MFNFNKLNIETGGRTSGRLKTFCPQCRDKRKDKRDKSLSIDLDKGIFLCHYCNWKGTAASGRQEPAEPRPPISRQLPPSIDPPAQWSALLTARAITPEALRTLGVTFAHEYLHAAGGKVPCICFNYYERGRRVNTKWRSLNKEFKLTAGAEMIPYNIDGIEATPCCIITEGEMDALAFASVGRTDVVSVPGGANRNLTWIDRFVESHFEDKEAIYIAVDTDAKGIELRNELVRRLGAERCRIVTYEEGCKDAGEQLVAHGAESLLRCLIEAPETPLEGVYTATDVEEELRTLYENGFGPGADTGLPAFDERCTFELGRLCVVTGIPGCGKSEFVDELVLRLALRHGWKTAFFSPENMPLVYHLRKLAEKLTGHHFTPRLTSETLYRHTVQWLSNHIVSILPDDDFTSDGILSRARELVRRRGIRVLVVDPFNRIEHRIPHGQSETQYISAFLDGLTNFAQRNHCLVIVVAHPRKMRREPGQLREPVPTLYDINGSAAFFNKCDFGLVVERDREVNVTRIHVEKVKFRHLGTNGVAPLVYNPTNGRFSPCRENTDASLPGQRVTDVQFDGGCWI